MIGSTIQFWKVIVVGLALAVLASGSAAAQQRKAGPSVDGLIKSIGLTKPTFTRAPDFNLRDGGGGIASLGGDRGNLTLLNFWATWCGPCREEMPSMEQLSRSFGGQGFTILAINQRESAAQVGIESEQLVLAFLRTHAHAIRRIEAEDTGLHVACRRQHTRDVLWIQLTHILLRDDDRVLVRWACQSGGAQVSHH